MADVTLSAMPYHPEQGEPTDTEREDWSEPQHPGYGDECDD
jgi:hypothetical protein